MENNAMNTNQTPNMPEYGRINSKDLIPHPVAQRKFSQKHGDNLAANWSWNDYEPVCVSYRNGRYWVIDGQHRVYAIKKRNGGKDCSIYCRIFRGMTILDEAEYFLHTDGKYAVAPLRPGDKFKVQRDIGDEVINGMERGAELAGWEVDFGDGSKNGRISALCALKQCFEALPYEYYVSMLRVLRQAWGDDKNAVNGKILKGMSVFYKTYSGRFKPDELAHSLSHVTPKVVIREGREIDSGFGSKRGIETGRAWARIILRYYNAKRKKNKLEDVL